MKSPWHVMTGGDWLVVLLLLCTSLAGMAWVAAAPQGARVVVTSGNQIRFTAPLEQPHTVDFAGPLGPTRIVIDDHGVRIVDSPCPRKVCLAMGPARHAGELVACVPNHILVRIEGTGSEESAYDLLSR